MLSLQLYPVRVRQRGGGAVVQHATVPGESETRDEAVGAVVQHATVPSESEMRDERWVRLLSVQQYPDSDRG